MGNGEYWSAVIPKKIKLEVGVCAVRKRDEDCTS